MESGTDSNLEADIEDGAEVLGGESVGRNQRERTDVGCRIPAPGDLPASGPLCPIHHLL